MERYLATGLPLNHVDGHHHLHMHPVIFDILVRCMEDYKIPWVRLVDEGRRARRPGDPLLGELVAAIFGLLAARHRRVLGRLGAARAPDRAPPRPALAPAARCRRPRASGCAMPAGTRTIR